MFVYRLFVNQRISNFIRIRPMGVESFPAGGRTARDMTKILAAFCDVANAPKMNQAVGRADCPCEGFIDGGLWCARLFISGTTYRLFMKSPGGTVPQLVLTSLTLSVTLVLSEKQLKTSDWNR
jgi:hypothetical protein